MLGFAEVSSGQVVLSAIAAWCIYVLVQALYNLYFHPLANFPGPKLRGAFHFPHQAEVYTGKHIYNWHHLHEKYGDFVRVSPTQLSVINPDAWKDIYGYGNKQPMHKCPDFYYRNPGDAVDIMTANNEDHTRARRLLNHAFSEQALRDQEDIITSYINLLITKLRNQVALGHPVDIMKYLNFTTFDITGDLTFDESFGSLDSENYDHWIANIFNMIRIGCIMKVLRFYGVPVMELFKIVPSLRKAADTHIGYTKEKMERRLNKKTERKDFMSYIMRHNSERGISNDEIKQTSGLVILAGSETSATLLSGAVYHLIKNPAWLKKLQDEIGTAFTEENQITFTSSSKLKVMNAVIQETFRLYPPAPGSLPRVSPKGGSMVAGTFVPPDTQIGVPQYPASRSSHNFTDPGKYAPERFLGDERYAHDKRAVIQPFSVGPRNCIGQNLAWAELRTILCRLIWNFDFEMLDSSRDWEKQRVFVLWDKPSLMVKLKARKS